MEDNEIRIFPFYKGQFMGRSNEGYSNKKSALKYMIDIPDEDVYDKFGGKDEYDKTHKYFCKLYEGDEDWMKYFSFNDKKSRSIPYDNPHSRQFYDIKDEDISTKVYYKDIPESELNDMLNLLNKINIHCFNDTTEENLNNIRLFETTYNLFPMERIDYDDYEKMKTKIRKNEIVYKRGIVKIEYKIDYLDA